MRKALGAAGSVMSASGVAWRDTWPHAGATQAEQAVLGVHMRAVHAVRAVHAGSPACCPLLMMRRAALEATQQVSAGAVWSSWGRWERCHLLLVMRQEAAEAAWQHLGREAAVTAAACCLW